jgi:hypothetical protein
VHCRDTYSAAQLFKHRATPNLCVVHVHWANSAACVCACACACAAPSVSGCDTHPQAPHENRHPANSSHTAEQLWGFTQAVMSAQQPAHCTSPSRSGYICCDASQAQCHAKQMHGAQHQLRCFLFPFVHLNPGVTPPVPFTDVAMPQVPKQVAQVLKPTAGTVLTQQTKGNRLKGIRVREPAKSQTNQAASNAPCRYARHIFTQVSPFTNRPHSAGAVSCQQLPPLACVRSGRGRRHAPCSQHAAQVKSFHFRQ